MAALRSMHFLADRGRFDTCERIRYEHPRNGGTTGPRRKAETMNREKTSSFHMVWLLAAVTSICVGIATYAFYRESDRRGEGGAASRLAKEPTRPSAASNPQRTGVAGHQPVQQERSGPDRGADRLSEQREAFLRELAKSASRNEAPTPQAPDDGASEPSQAGEDDQPTRAEELRERWAADEPDPAWTDEMSQQTRSMLDQHDIDGSVSDVSCRTTVCRIEFDFADLNEAMKLAQETREQLGLHWNTQSHEGDEVTIRVLVERKRR